ncbi:MAG: molybdopterin-dependent oxidoreductase [Bacteroidia bacterium]
MAETIKTLINGESRQFQVEVETCAVEVIREQAHLTGTKLVCGSGACGACTVLLDGQPRCSCILPATHLDGRSVQTIEGINRQDWHPVQKAFLANDALQCGFCTPGFITESVAFYNDWKAKHQGTRPTRDDVAAALAGHYCRCGAYPNIYTAVQDACEGKFDGPEQPSYIRNDGPSKVTGAAKYTTDIQLPGQLTGAIFRSSIPHGKLKRLDIEAAKSKPGVKAVIRIKEDDIIHYEGEPLAAVAAETEEQAHAALQSIIAEYEPLPFVLDVRESMNPSGVLLHPGDNKAIPLASEAPPFPGSWDRNVRRTSISITSSGSGKAKRLTEKADKKAANYFGATFKTPTQFHTCLEPHCAVADWKEGGKLTVYASTQSVFFLAEDIAEHYKLKLEDVLVVAENVGGAFGSKLTFYTAIRTAIDLSKAAAAPVAVIYSRSEEFTETGYRPSSEIEVAITADADGSNPAYTMSAYGNSGYAIGSNTADISGIGYTGISKDLTDYDVLTNFQPGAAFRGPGGPGALFALEQSIDQLAHQLKIEPIAFRRKWEKHEGYLQLFDWVEKQDLWKRRLNAETPKGFRKGVGVAFGGWMHLYMPSAIVEVEASPAGFVVRNAVQDMGQGSRTVLAQAVANVFGISPISVKVEVGFSNFPIGPTSGGSRTTATIYPAAFEAAEKLRDSIVKEVARKKSLSDAKAEAGGIAHAGGKMPWQEAIQQITLLQERVTRGHNDGFNPMGLMPLDQGMEVGQNRGYGVYIVEVEVEDTGKVKVTEVRGAMRVGKVHVPQIAINQCQGGAVQGIGHVLYEDRALCKTSGRVLSRGLEDYRIPGIGDIPPIQIDFIEEGFDMVKQKGVGLAELCTVPVAGAVANAIFNATGYRPLTAPVTPERILAGMQSLVQKD